jgi:23S rRNA (pseudouridine1915-N3)-methyltransferase
VKVQVVRVGSGRCAWADEAVAGWKARLQSWGASEASVAAEPYRGDAGAVRRAEGSRLLKTLKERDRLVALDVRGDALDTDRFARLVAEGRAHGTLAFALGGAYGLDDAVRARAFRVVRLTDLVLAHDVARVVLWEQLYRAWAIEAGSPYHQRPDQL